MTFVAPDDGLTHIVAMPLNDDTIIAIDPDDWETRYRQLLKITNRLLDERYGEGGTEAQRRDALTDTIDKLLCHVPMPYNIQGEIKAWRDRQLKALSEAGK